MTRYAMVVISLIALNSASLAQIKVTGPEVGQVNNQYIIKVDEIKGSDLKIKYLKDGLISNDSADYIQLKDNDDKPVIVVFTRNPGVYTFIFASATTSGKADITIHTLKIGQKPDIIPNPNPEPKTDYESKLTTLLQNKNKTEIDSLLKAWLKTDPSLYNTNLGFLNGLIENTKNELGPDKLTDVRKLIGEYMKASHANPNLYDLPKLKIDHELTARILQSAK